MRCEPCPSEGVRPSWTRGNWLPRTVILQRPTEHGFATELWTLKRVGAVIERMHGVRFSQTQIWRILGSLGFSVQKPEKRAIERNEDAVRSWKRSTWPALKKKPNDRVD